MKIPRVSIAWMMFGVAMACVPLTLLQNATSGRPWIGRHSTMAMGLWPTLVVFGIVSFSMFRHPKKRTPFRWAIAVVGWGSVVVFLVACHVLSVETLSLLPAYYFNEIDPFDSEYYSEFYMTNLLFIGFLLALPQLLLALGAGLIARTLWGPRWNSTSS